MCDYMKKNNIKKNIILFSNANNEPKQITDARLEFYNKLDNFNHPSFGPEIKLDIDFISHCNNKPTPFHIEKEGFIACDIHTAFNKYPQIIEKFYGKLIDASENRYTALNTTIFESGYFIYVPKNCKLPFPIFNRNLNCEFTKNVIIVDENAELKFIDYHKSKSDFKCDTTEIFIQKNGKCKYLNINIGNNNETSTSIKRAEVLENGNIEWINIIKDLNIFMGYPTSLLRGDKAFASCVTLSLSSNFSSINTGVKMIHEAPNTKSKIINIGNILDSGELEIRNLIRMKKNAINSKSIIYYKYNKNNNANKYDNIPKFIVNNDSSKISFKIKSKKSININLNHFITKYFGNISHKNKKYLKNLLKEDL